MNTGAIKFGLFAALPAFLRRRIMIRRYKREIAFSGEAELAHLQSLVKPGDLALDVGSNLGAYTYELSRLTGRVIAFEPNAMLARLVASLNLPGVEVKQVALSTDDGDADLLVPMTNGGHGLASLKQEAVNGLETRAVRVATRRLDGLGLDTVAFVKIDVEGFEEDVLDGAEGILLRDRPTLLIEIEERHNPGGLERIRARLEGMGYSGRFLRHEEWHPLREFDAAIHQRTSDINEVGRSIARREHDYVNNFVFVTGDGHT